MSVKIDDLKPGDKFYVENGQEIFMKLKHTGPHANCICLEDGAFGLIFNRDKIRLVSEQKEDKKKLMDRRQLSEDQVRYSIEKGFLSYNDDISFHDMVKLYKKSEDVTREIGSLGECGYSPDRINDVLSTIEDLREQALNTLLLEE